MNILSFDIEEWYLEKAYLGDCKEKYVEYDSLLSQLLDILEENNTKATFFCLGVLAKSFPNVVKKISERNHEIGCHSYSHHWINKMTSDEFYIDTRDALSALEDCIGKKIISYRAPAFSIGQNNKWAFEVLARCGIENDASVFPGSREFGGFSTFDDQNGPCRIIFGCNEINEYPITLTNLPIVQKKIAYSGGGYFRLFPLWYVKKIIRRADYVMCYFHIADLISSKSKFKSKIQYEEYFKEKGSLQKRFLRYLKSNIGRSRALVGLKDLIESFDFCSIEDASKLHLKKPTVKLD